MCSPISSVRDTGTDPWQWQVAINGMGAYAPLFDGTQRTFACTVSRDTPRDSHGRVDLIKNDVPAGTQTRHQVGIPYIADWKHPSISPLHMQSRARNTEYTALTVSIWQWISTASQSPPSSMHVSSVYVGKWILRGIALLYPGKSTADVFSVDFDANTPKQKNDTQYVTEKNVGSVTLKWTHDCLPITTSDGALFWTDPPSATATLNTRVTGSERSVNTFVKAISITDWRKTAASPRGTERPPTCLTLDTAFLTSLKGELGPAVFRGIGDPFTSIEFLRTTSLHPDLPPLLPEWSMFDMQYWKVDRYIKTTDAPDASARVSRQTKTYIKAARSLYRCLRDTFPDTTSLADKQRTAAVLMLTIPALLIPYAFDINMEAEGGGATNEQFIAPSLLGTADCEEAGTTIVGWVAHLQREWAHGLRGTLHSYTCEPVDPDGTEFWQGVYKDVGYLLTEYVYGTALSQTGESTYHMIAVGVHRRSLAASFDYTRKTMNTVTHTLPGLNGKWSTWLDVWTDHLKNVGPLPPADTTGSPIPQSLVVLDGIQVVRHCSTKQNLLIYHWASRQWTPWGNSTFPFRLVRYYPVQLMQHHWSTVTDPFKSQSDLQKRLPTPSSPDSDSDHVDSLSWSFLSHATLDRLGSPLTLTPDTIVFPWQKSWTNDVLACQMYVSQCYPRWIAADCTLTISKDSKSYVLKTCWMSATWVLVDGVPLLTQTFRV